MSQMPPQNPYQGTGFNMGGGDAAALAQVSAPATGLLVTAGIGALLQLVALLANLAGAGMGAIGAAAEGGAPGGPDATMAMLSGTIGMASNVIALFVAGLIIFGALKMKSLQSYSLAMVSSILAIVPCVSPCCVLGLPIGIWAVVVLMRPEVKAAFRG